MMIEWLNKKVKPGQHITYAKLILVFVDKRFINHDQAS